MSTIIMTIINDNDIQGMPIRLLFVRYLMTSYLYYEMDEGSPWSDPQYDQACKRLDAEWDTFEHGHKWIASRDDLKAGSGYSIRSWPTIVRQCASTWGNLGFN